MALARKLSDKTARERVEAGDPPSLFWINSMGEYGHQWPDGTETLGGSVNVKDAVDAYGGLLSEEAAIKRDFERQLFEECVDPRELLLYRSWEALTPLEGAGFQFHGQFVDGTPHLSMTIEYILEHTEALRELVQQFSRYNATFQKMWDDHDGGVQYCVTIPGLFGRSFAEVAEIQYRWLTQAQRLASKKVNIL